MSELSNISHVSPWIRHIETLNPAETAQLNDGYPFLKINDEYAFDLLAWRQAMPWKSNAIQPRSGSQFKNLRDDIMSRGMDHRPVLELVTGWVADGNSRLQVYDDCLRDGMEIPFPGFELRAFASDTERHDYQVGAAIMNRHLKTRERKVLVRQGIKVHADWADNRIAALYGLTQDTVSRISSDMIAAGEVVRPDIRIGADGREYDSRKLKHKTRRAATHPATPLIVEWHKIRGGHITSSDDVMALAAGASIDLAELGAIRPASAANERARRLSLTAWLGKLDGVRFGSCVLTAFRAPNGWNMFSLVRVADYRPNLNPDTPEPLVPDEREDEVETIDSDAS